jgi:valyl-tRNA synthetase
MEAHRAYLKMLAPFLSHITEEIWSDMYEKSSIHRSDWPEEKEVEADLEAGENAMEVISGIRKYKSDNQMAPNDPLEKVQVYGKISGFEDAIKEVMHVEELEELDSEPETEKKIIRISLDYSKAGPKYGDRVGEIEDALENNEYSIDAGHLEVAGEHLKPEMFEVDEERTYTGEGNMIETENTLVIVKEA